MPKHATKAPPRTPTEQAEAFVKSMHQAGKEIKAGGPDATTKAIGIFMGHPQNVSIVRANIENPDRLYAATYSLESAHREAVRHLMQLAEKQELNSALLSESGAICRRIVRDGKCGAKFLWVERFPDEELTATERDTVRQADGIFHRLAIQLENAVELVPLEAEDKAILQCLNKEYPYTAEGWFIESEENISHRTATARFKYLEKHGLIERPHGPRSGFIITDFGKKHIPRMER